MATFGAPFIGKSSTDPSVEFITGKAASVQGGSVDTEVDCISMEARSTLVQVGWAAIEAAGLSGIVGLVAMHSG